MSDGWAGVGDLLAGVRLHEMAVLGGSDRSVVRRVRAARRSLIVKEFTGAGEGWVICRWRRARLCRRAGR